MNSGIRTQLESVLPLPEVPESTTYMAPHDLLMRIEPIEHTITEKELKEKREKREAVLNERKRSPYLADTPDYNAIHAQGFLRVLEHIERIEDLIDSAERRRNSAYKALEQYRAQREGRRRSPSPSIIAGEFKDVSSGNSAVKPKTRHDV
jgi:hypothetical protein